MTFRRVVRFILNNLDEQRGKFRFATIVGFLHGLEKFIIPLLIAWFVDRIIAGERPSLIPFVLGFGSLYAIEIGLEYYLRRRGELIGPLFRLHLRNKLFAILLNHRSLWDKRFHSVYVLTMVNRITDMGEKIVFRWLWAGTQDVIFIPAVIAYITWQDWTIGLFTVGVLLAFFWIGVILTRKLSPVFEDVNRETASFTSQFGDFMSNIRTVKKLHIEGYVLQQTAAHEALLGKKLQRLQRLHANRWGLLDSLFGVAYVGTMSWFILGVKDGHIAVGSIVLLLYSLNRVVNLLESTIENVRLFVESSAYLTTLEPFLLAEATTDTTNKLPHSWSTIQLDNAYFKHPQSEDAFSLSVNNLIIHRQDRIGLAGKSGHGKSTLFDLLARHYKPTSGSVKLDQADFETLPKEWFAQNLSYITQDAELFSMSLRDNILLGQTVSPERLREVIVGCQLKTLVDSLDQGLDSVVGERGIKLSTGERQRVNIARGILLNREIYLLDEITSNIDRRTEGKILNFLFQQLAGKTILFITHRLENLKTMDRIAVVDQGALVAEGSFAELEKSNKLFRELLAHPELMQLEETRNSKL